MQEHSSTRPSVEIGHDMNTGQPVHLHMNAVPIIAAGDDPETLTAFCQLIAASPNLADFHKTVADTRRCWQTLKDSNAIHNLHLITPDTGQENFTEEQACQILHDTFKNTTTLDQEEQQRLQLLIIDGALPVQKPPSQSVADPDHAARRHHPPPIQTIITVTSIDQINPSTGRSATGHGIENSCVIAFKQNIQNAARLAPLLNLIPDEQRRLTNMREDTALLIPNKGAVPVPVKVSPAPSDQPQA